MLNFDMIASRNFARFLYDGDQGSFPPGPDDLVAPPGSDEIERGCDDIFNLNKRGFEEMADAAAHVPVTLAQAKTLPGRSASVAAAAARTAAAADVHGLSRPATPAEAGS